MIDFLNEQFSGLWGNDEEGFRVRHKRRRTWEYYLYMLNRLQGMFDWHNLPDTIPQRNLELILMSCGNACITKVEGELYAFWGGLGGEPNVYYEPTVYTVSNPALNYSANLKIGKECVRMRNDATGLGLSHVNMKYAHLLNENDISMRILDINYRIQNLLSASDDRTADSAKQYLDDIESGKLGVISESEFFDGIKAPIGARSGENIKDLIEYHQYLKASWYNELGINANYNMKRERLQSDEAGLNDDALLTLVDNMLECRRKACDEVNELYGTEWGVDLAGAWLKEEIETQVAGVDFDSDADENVNEIDREDGEMTDAEYNALYEETIAGEDVGAADDNEGTVADDEEPQQDGGEADGEEPTEPKADAEIEINVNVNIDTDAENEVNEDETTEPKNDMADVEE